MNRQVQTRLFQDIRNHGIEIAVNRTPPIVGDDIVIDLRSIGSGKAPIDLFRVLLQTADAIGHESFSRVTLATRGDPRFVIAGEEFRTFGAEYHAGQNPIYLVRTFPERLFDPKTGKQRFASWTGGILGVLAKQMEDFGGFIRVWVSGVGAVSDDIGTAG